MPQPPTLYRPITTAPDELGLTQKSIDRERLARDEEDARKARQAALDAHLSGFADDPVSKALATADFVLQEEDAQKAKAQKEYDDVVSKHDDPVMKAWAVAEHYAKQSDAPEAQKAFADRNRLEMLRERDKNAATLDRAGNYGMGVADAFVRETIGSAVNVVPDLASVVARLKGEEDVANQLNRESQQFGEARDQARSDDMSPWLSRMYGGASQSLMQTAATPGGAASKIIGAGVTSGNQALTTAEDAGLEGAAKYRYAGSQAAFETGVALLGQKFFGGGIESRLAGQTVAAQTWKALAKNIGTDALKEMPEEVVTAILQDVSSKLEGVSPDMNFADFVTNATEAAVQAAMMAPMANAGNAAALAFRQKPSKQNYDAAVSAGMPPIDNPNREGRTKYAADLEAAAQKQPAPEPTTKEGVSIETPSEATPEQATLEPTAPAANPDNAPDTEYDEILNLLQKGDPNEAKDQTGQAPEASAEGQGQAEGLLTEPPAETQEQTTPADSQENRESPAAQTKAEFEKEYRDNFARMMQYTPDQVGSQHYADRMAAMADAHPDWADEIENQKESPVATGEPSPDQSQPLTEAGPVSLPDTVIAKTLSAAVTDIKPEDSDGWRMLPRPIKAQMKSKDGTPITVDVRGFNPDTGDVDAWNPTKRHAYADVKIADLVDAPTPDTAQAAPRRGVIGDMLTTGEVVQTASGRPTTPFPKIATDTKRKTAITLRKAEEWLQSNALAEAESRGDEFNALQFRNEKPGKMPKATKDSMEEYLFGEQPAVVPSILKPLMSPPAESTVSPPVSGFAALPQKSQDLFNKAFESKDVESLKQMVDKNNVAWNTEFQTRTGIKLPKTLKGRQQAVSEWAANPSPASVIESPDLQLERQRTKDADDRKQAIKDEGFVVGDRVTQESTGRKGVLEAISDTSGTIAVRFDEDGSVLSGTDVSGFVRGDVNKTAAAAPKPATPAAESDIKAAMRAELARQAAEEATAKPAAAPKKPSKPRKPRTATGQKLEKMSEDTGKAAKKAIDDFLKEMGDLGVLSGLGINNKALVATAKMVRAQIADGVVKFADFVTRFVENTSPETARKLSAYLEAAWEISGETDSRLDAVGKVADILGPEKEVTNENGTTGTPDTEGRKADSGTGTGDRRDAQDAAGPADAEVLDGPPAKNGRKTKKARSPASVRDSAGGTVRSGSGETDSGGIDEPGGRGTDSGATSADDSGNGRGTDRAPQSTRPNYHLTNPDAIIGGGPKAKFERNRKAIEIVRDIEESNRVPTSEELDTLAGYMGWGAFGQELFNGSWENPRPKEGWEDQNEWLRTYLGEDEWKSAQQSIVNAHFTDPQTVTATWDMLRRMGFNGGRVLEPSAGIGNFFSLMPRDLMERSSLTGIELDKMTAKIATLLHPQANIQQKGYQESQTPDNFYDVIVSNVPFGNYKIADRRYKQDLSIHNYFFKRAFDQVKPGGVLAFLTSNMTMDGKTQAKLLRAQITKQGGELVTAIRFPSGAFQAYAGTKVVADLIIIRKRKDGDPPQETRNWIDVVEVDTPAGQKISVNEFWTKNPSNILGQMTWGHGTTSGRPGMIVNQPTDLQSLLNEAVTSLPENIINTARAATEGRERANTTAMRQNSVIAQDNDLWIVKGEQLVPLLEVVAWNRKGSKQATIDKNRKEIESLLNVREAMRDVLDRQAASEDAVDARKALNETYDAFVAEHGPIGKSAAAKHLRKAGDPTANTLLALEKVTGLIFKKYEKRPIFERATVRQKQVVTSPSIDDAFAIERNRSLDLDMDRIASAANVTVDEVIQKLESQNQIYKTGNGTYDASDVFLSGNMSRKLRQLEAAQLEGMEGLERSIEAVRERIPVPIPYSQIEAKLGASWIEASDYADMIGHLLNEPGSAITVERKITGWKVTIPSNINGKTEATTIHGHPGIAFSKLVTAAMNNASVKLTTKDEDGNTVADPQATTEANAKIGELRENFPNWLWSSADRIARLSGAYNEEFNSTVTPEFDDVPLQFEGMAIERGEKPLQLRKHQRSAIWRGIVSGKGIFAHEVGTGKTLTMAGLAMESRRLGIASKPILIAHNANSLAVRNEIQEAYPSANILYVDNLDAVNKGATLQSIATENWDLIVVPHSMAENFQLRPETVEALLKPEMDALEAAALEAFEESESSDFAKGSMPADLNSIDKETLRALKEPTAKELVKERLKLRAQIDKATQAMNKGTGVFFEDMGVDMVMVDEAHLFKKLPLTTKQNIKGLNKTASQMGTMMMMLTDYIRANNNGRGVYMFTGTPITNTINEIFNMMRFVMAEEMEASNVRQWDSWFNNFATQETLTELSSGGTWENFDRLSSFVNLPELRQMVGQYMDIVFADDMEEFKPREQREGRTEDPVGRPFKQVHNVIIDMIDAQRAHSANLAERYSTFRDASGKDKVRMMREPGGLFNPLVIEGEGVKLAMDPRLTGFGTKEQDNALVTDTSKLDPKDPNLKINKMIQNSLTHYHEHPKSAQMVFMQVGYTDWAERTVGRDAAGDPIKQKFRVFNLAKEIKRRLIEEGVPESEIAIFSGMSKEKRTETANMMRDGIVRFAIGSTETMGTGINAQDELVAMHHLDAPWMPGDLEQRNGRGHRQGNKWNTVHEYRYLTEGPQDGRRWQVLLTKDKFIKEFMRGDSTARVIEMDDVDMSDDGGGTDMEQTFSAAAGDPRIMQRIRLEGQVERLLRQRDNHARTITETANQANRKLGGVKTTTGNIAQLTSMYDTWAANKTETPQITLRGKTYTGNQDITDQLQEIGDRYQNSIHPRQEIGTYRGLPLFVDNGVLYVGTGTGYGTWANSDAHTTVTARWNLQSLQGILSNLPERINKMKQGMEKDQRFIEMAQKAVGEPFPKQKQLETKQKQLQKLQSEMTKNPTVSPAWLRTGAPLGTDVYWKGTKYEVTGHRGDDQVLYSENDEFKPLPAAELTDAEGTRLFPDLELPVETPDEATPAADEAPESELRKSAREAREAVDAQKAENDRQNKIIAAELRKTNLGSGAPISDELAKAVATRMIGAIRLGVKQFDAFIKELRANLAEADVTGLKPTLIRTWNAIREKHGLDEASDAGFDAAMSDTVDVDVEQAIEAVKGEPPIAETGDAAATQESAAGVAEPVSTYSTKNAFSAAARERMDMGERPPVTPQPREPSVTLAEEIGRTAAGRERIDLLIGELIATPRAVTPLENDLLNFRNAELGNKLEAALRKQIDSRKNGDSAQEAVAEREAIVFKKQKQDLIELVLEPIGTAAGRALQARKAVINQDYTLERLSLEYEAAYGEAPSTAKLAEMQKQIDDLNASIKELERQLAEESAKREDLEARLKDAHDTVVQDTKPAAPPKKATVLERLAKEGKEQVESGFKKLSAMLGKVYSIEGAAADLTEALIEIATGYSKQGVVRLADFLNRVGKRMGPKAKEIQAELISAWNTVRGNSTMTEQEQITNKIDILDPDTIGRAARDLHRFVIERDGLDASAEGREAAVNAVHAILVDFVPGITGDEVARAMSGIGIYSELNKDDIEVIRRDQKAQLLSLQQIADWMKGEAPPATGQERPPVSDEQRLLRRMVNEAKKAAGLVTTTEGQLRSALDAAKRMARNRIADLTKAIESGTRIERSRRVLEDPSGELQTLQAERDALQKLYNEAFGKPELSDAQKLNRAEKALDRAISNLESDLKAGKLYDDAPKAPVTSPEIDAKRAALAALKASREEMRLQSGEAQARSDAAYERLLKQREADLAQRLADGDFAPPGKKPERKFTPEMLKTMQSIAKQRQELKKQSDAWVFENRHIVYKAYMKGPVAGAHMLRKLLTTLDQSLIGRQGWLLGLTHPKIYAKSARQAFASNPIQARSMFPTEQDLFNTQAALDADANWVRLEKIGKLAVTDVHGGINREEDSRFVPEWFDKVWGIGGSERAGSAFINTQRRLVFRNLVSKLSTKLDGKNASLSNADLRVIGNLVNVASGRGGIGKWTGALDALTLVFFSPRWWVSRLSWWVGQPVWHDSRWFGGDGASTEVRQMAAAEWAKQAAAQIAVMGVAVAGLTAAFGAGGDDEEWEYYVDPRSPNFGRIRIGNTRIDMTAGLGQHLSLMSRLATGTQVDRWETKDVDKADLVGKHLRGKLAPVPSAFWDYLEGQSIGGEKFGTKEWIRDHSLPLIFQEANTAIKEEGAFTGGLLSAWMFFGGTAQTYEARVKSRVDITNELRAMKKQGKSPEQIQATLNKHLAHMAGLEAKDHVRTANPEEAAALQTVIKGESSPELLAAIQKEKYDIILNASGRVSSDPKRIHDDKGFTGSDDASRRSARSLVKTMIPDVNEAIDLYEDAYRARNNSIYEKNGKMKAAVWAGRARIRSIYAAE